MFGFLKVPKNYFAKFQRSCSSALLQLHNFFWHRTVFAEERMRRSNYEFVLHVFSLWTSCSENRSTCCSESNQRTRIKSSFHVRKCHFCSYKFTSLNLHTHRGCTPYISQSLYSAQFNLWSPSLLVNYRPKNSLESKIWIVRVDLWNGEKFFDIKKHIKVIYSGPELWPCEQIKPTHTRTRGTK